MQFLPSYYFFITKPMELIALLSAIIMTYIYINITKHKKTLFSPVCSDISRSLPDIFCFSCLPKKCKSECNTPFTVLWMMHQTSRSSSNPRTSYFVIFLDETQLCIKSWEYGLNEVWNYHFGCLVWNYHFGCLVIIVSQAIFSYLWSLFKK